ncbi:MAG: ABC-type transport auxiliary lipoprotein family protein [Gemmatimonadaceae bacterium]
MSSIFPSPSRPALGAVLAGVVSLACFGGTVRTPELYRLAPAAEPLPVANSSTAANNSAFLIKGSLAIDEYETPGIYGRHGIVYRVEETSYGVYPNREWAIPLGQMLGVFTESVLTRHPITTSTAVFHPPSTRTFTYTWRGRVREFEEVVRGKSVHAAVHLEAQLVRTSDDSVVWTGSQRTERPVPEATMPAIVAALGELAEAAMLALANDARRALENPPGGTN